MKYCKKEDGQSHPGRGDHDQPKSPPEDKSACVQVREMCGQDSGNMCFFHVSKEYSKTPRRIS